MKNIKKYKNDNIQKLIILEGFRQNGHYHRNQLMKARRGGEARRRRRRRGEARRGGGGAAAAPARAAAPRRPRAAVINDAFPRPHANFQIFYSKSCFCMFNLMGSALPADPKMQKMKTMKTHKNENLQKLIILEGFMQN